MEGKREEEKRGEGGEAVIHYSDRHMMQSLYLA